MIGILRIVGNAITDTDFPEGLEPYRVEPDDGTGAVHYHFELMSEDQLPLTSAIKSLTEALKKDQKAIREVIKNTGTAAAVLDVAVPMSTNKVSLNVLLPRDLLKSASDLGLVINIAVYSESA
jgi:hypothetical protein